jgi:hypothetical protein
MFIASSLTWKLSFVDNSLVNFYCISRQKWTILFDYKCFVIFKNSEANFVTAIELAYIYKK